MRHALTPGFSTYLLRHLVHVHIEAPAQVYGSDAAYSAPIMQDDGTEKDETIDELANLQALVATGARRPNNQGVYVSGQKYTLTRAVMAGAARDVEELRTFTTEVDGEDRTVIFNKVFMLNSGEHQLLVAEDKQTCVPADPAQPACSTCTAHCIAPTQIRLHCLRQQEQLQPGEVPRCPRRCLCRRCLLLRLC